LKEEAKVSEEELNRAVRKISLSGQLGVAYRLATRLTAEDLMYLESLAEGGLSAEEKEAAKALVYARFDEEEAAYIKELYHLYFE
jgi:hypothetical protein